MNKVFACSDLHGMYFKGVRALDNFKKENN